MQDKKAVKTKWEARKKQVFTECLPGKQRRIRLSRHGSQLRKRLLLLLELQHLCTHSRDSKKGQQQGQLNHSNTRVSNSTGNSIGTVLSAGYATSPQCRTNRPRGLSGHSHTPDTGGGSSCTASGTGSPCSSLTACCTTGAAVSSLPARAWRWRPPAAEARLPLLLAGCGVRSWLRLPLPRSFSSSSSPSCCCWARSESAGVCSPPASSMGMSGRDRPGSSGSAGAVDGSRPCPPCRCSGGNSGAMSRFSGSRPSPATVMALHQAMASPAPGNGTIDSACVTNGVAAAPRSRLHAASPTLTAELHATLVKSSGWKRLRERSHASPAAGNRPPLLGAYSTQGFGTGKSTSVRLRRRCKLVETATAWQEH